jgi:hypothetical protein
VSWWFDYLLKDAPAFLLTAANLLDNGENNDWLQEIKPCREKYKGKMVWGGEYPGRSNGGAGQFGW